MSVTWKEKHSQSQTLLYINLTLMFDKRENIAWVCSEGGQKESAGHCLACWRR